jgi:transposase
MGLTLDTAVLNYIKELEANHQQQIKELQNNFEARIKESEYKYLALEERYYLLIYKRFARSAEQLRADEKQPLLFAPETGPAEAPPETGREETTPVRSHGRKKGRKPLDPKLPRIERVVDIPETEKTCACGSGLTKIGEETSEKLHIVPPQIYVVRTIRPKYACRACEGTEDEDKSAVRIAPAEPAIIPKSIASPSLLSCIIIQKFEDHLPYYRQETQFERIGAAISRQDMSNWQQQAYRKLAPLFALLKGVIKKGPVMRMDETTVQVMGEEGREDTQKSYMWLARGGPPGKTVTLYEYRETRAALHAETFLAGYSGYLQTDGYEGYDAAVKDMPGIIHVGCFAHARRKFFEAAKVTGQGQSAEAGIRHIKALYIIETALRKRYGEREEDTEEKKNAKRKMFTRIRQMCAWRPLKEFKAWLVQLQEEVPPGLLLGKAVHYSLAQWDKMTAYLESPYLTPDNNACENAIRPFVLGRKNWLFCKSPEGAESSCGIYSLIETAKQNGLVPLHYLTALFEKAPYASSPGDWEKLLPWNIFTA